MFGKGIRIAAIALIVCFSAIGTAAAGERDRAFESVQGVISTLIQRIDAGQASDKQIWAGVQGITDIVHRFVLAETEIRAGNKVEPPAIASLRPGQAEQAPPSQAPGAPVEMAAVPTDWFNARATLAQQALDAVRSALEQNQPPADLAIGLRRLLATVDTINRPPA